VTVFTFYQRGNPALCYLFEALARHVPMRHFWSAEWVDVLRLAIGRAQKDPNRPTPLPINWKSLAAYGEEIGRQVQAGDTVIFTRPDQAVLLPFFQTARKIFYVLDDYRTYGRDWTAEDLALLKACDHVIAVSPALGQLLETRMPGVSVRLTISANAVPASWIPPTCPAHPAPIPGFKKGGPLVGVIGSISSRLRLDWLAEAVDHTPALNWLFVGGIEKDELREEDRAHFEKLDRHPRCYFTGPKPYEELFTYCRGLDVALLPYSERSTNPYGSAMRLFMHLPFGQPIIATPGCRMVEDFVPLVSMAESASHLAKLLNEAARMGAEDPLRQARWQASFQHTWDVRAEVLRNLVLA